MQSLLTCTLDRATSMKYEKRPPRMTQDIWDIVIKDIPSLSARYASKVFGFNLTPQQHKHSTIWSAIFKYSKWASIALSLGLNPLLVGFDLYDLYHNLEEGYPAYIVLVTGDWAGDLHLHREELMSSLNDPNLVNKAGTEVYFPESNITLNIEEAIFGNYGISLEPRRLFSPNYKHLRSACLYYNDSQDALCIIEPEDIVGVGGKAPSIQNASMICAFTLSYPEEITIFSNGKEFLKRTVHQAIFEIPGEPDKSLVEIVWQKEPPRLIEGWRKRD